VKRRRFVLDTLAGVNKEISVGLGWFQRRMPGNAATVAERCDVCASPDLFELATDAYLCNSCGYEGGAGYARYLQSKGNHTIGVKSIRDLRVQAAYHLRDVRELLHPIVDYDGVSDGRVFVRVGAGLGRDSLEGRRRARLRQALGELRKGLLVLEVLRERRDAVGRLATQFAPYSQASVGQAREILALVKVTLDRLGVDEE